jgi:Flp pilus assembly pilin Flp
MLTSTYITTIWLRHHVADIVRSAARSERGAALVEYAFLLSFIVAVCMAAVTLLGSNNNASATKSAASITAAN